MSKSKGNLVFVSKLIQAGTDPMVIRFALMSQHYRLDRMWTDELLLQATQRVNQIRKALASEVVAPTESVIEQIVSALSDDLDTPSALAALDHWACQTLDAGTGGDAQELSTVLDALLGLAL
jgi:L-cysteine:1D-myo-inositol 2-amino-2-deoxy-alpha-D-glucopyranoside ligase